VVLCVASKCTLSEEVSMERIEVAQWLLQIMEMRRLTEKLPRLISTLTRLPESQLLGKTAEVGLNSSNHVCGMARLLWVMSLAPHSPPPSPPYIARMYSSTAPQ